MYFSWSYSIGIEISNLSDELSIFLSFIILFSIDWILLSESSKLDISFSSEASSSLSVFSSSSETSSSLSVSSFSSEASSSLSVSSFSSEASSSLSVYS